MKTRWFSFIIGRYPGPAKRHVPALYHPLQKSSANDLLQNNVFIMGRASRDAIVEEHMHSLARTEPLAYMYHGAGLHYNAG